MIREVGERMTTKVILDTNALMMPFQFGINLTAELKRLLGTFEIIVPSSVIDELGDLRPKDMAKAAKTLASKFRTVKSEGKGDQAVLSLAQELGAIVVTNDKLLIKALKELKLPVIQLRSRTHLVLSGSYL